MNSLFRLDGRIALVTGASGGLGAHFATVLADQLARLLFAPVELPVGMVTTLMGAPMMIYLALKIK